MTGSQIAPVPGELAMKSNHECEDERVGRGHTGIGKKSYMYRKEQIP